VIAHHPSFSDSTHRIILDQSLVFIHHFYFIGYTSFAMFSLYSSASICTVVPAFVHSCFYRLDSCSISNETLIRYFSSLILQLSTCSTINFVFFFCFILFVLFSFRHLSKHAACYAEIDSNHLRAYYSFGCVLDFRFYFQ
jgi:hypothetical protein